MIKRYYMVTIQHDTNDMLFFFRHIDFEYEVRGVAFNYGGEGIRMTVETILHDLEANVILYDLGVISDMRSSLDEIKDKMKGWTCDMPGPISETDSYVEPEQSHEALPAPQED